MNLKRIRLWLLSLLTLVSLITSVCLSHFIHTYPSAAFSHSTRLEAKTAQQYDQLGRDRFRLSQFQHAADAWQQALMRYEQEGNGLAQAQVLSNLSLSWQQLGQWSEAEGAIADSLTLLNRVNADSSAQAIGILAQTLNTQGSLNFTLGRMHDALTQWEQAADWYAQADDEMGRLSSQINQVQAMQELGFHRLAIKQLQTINDICHQTYPDSPLQADVLRRLGDGLRLTGHFEQSQQVLAEGVAIAQTQHLSGPLANLFFSLGKTASAQMDHAAAQAFYTQALANTPSVLLKTQIELAQLQAFTTTQQWTAALERWPDIPVLISQLPHHRESIYAQISLATQLIELIQEQHPIQESSYGTGYGTSYGTNIPTWDDITHVLEAALQRSQDIGDHRAETYAFGYLGAVYEHTHAWPQAETLTQRALLIAQGLDAADISYRWQWQLGRILKAEGKTKEAIAAYSEATDLLTHLRGDLIATGSEEQFRFREQVEPIYRELVSLLIPADSSTPIEQSNLVKARDVIEALQLAELDNFFKEACLDEQSLQIDQVDQTAAVFYPIILGDRLEIILSLPNQPLRHYTTVVSEEELTALANNFRRNLVTRSRFAFRVQARQLYDWLVRPALDDLTDNQIETLVFVLDGPLRNLPMAALNDGDAYLLESYRIAVAPGLQLIAMVHMVAGWESRGTTYFNRSIELSRQFQDVWGQGHSLSWQGMGLYARSRYRDAIELMEQAVENFDRAGDVWERNITRFHVGLCHFALGDLRKSAEIQRETCLLSLDIGDSRSLCSSYGWCRATEGRMPMEELRSNIPSRPNDVLSTINHIKAVGYWHLCHGRTGEAVEEFENAWELTCRNLHVFTHTIATLPLLVRSLRMHADAIAVEQPGLAAVNRKKALRIARRSAWLTKLFPSEQTAALREYGLTLQNMGNHQKALKLFERSCLLSENREEEYELAQSLLARAQCRKQLGITGAEKDIEQAERKMDGFREIIASLNS